ncbi:MAG: DUF4908 domain-containing protein [bacterium]
MTLKGKWLFYRRAPWWRVWVLTLLTFICSWLVLSDVSYAQGTSLDEVTTGDPFAALLTQRGPAAVRLSNHDAQLYETTEGDETFIFQANGNQGRIRFLCDEADQATLECALLQGKAAEEIFLLTATRSPRGDVIYKDSDKQPVLRITSNGGATLFNPKHNETTRMAGKLPLGGQAVLPIPVHAASLKAPAIRYRHVEERMRRASDLLYQRHQTLITFVAEGPSGGDQAVLADAILTAAKGVDMVASDELGARYIINRLRQIQFVPADSVSMELAQGILTINYVRQEDLAGRPSSISVTRFLEAKL